MQPPPRHIERITIRPKQPPPANMPLPTLAAAHAYVTEHGLQELLQSAVNACIQANAADPIGFIIDHLKAVKEAAASNTMVAVEKEEATTAVVPAVTSEFDEALCEALAASCVRAAPSPASTVMRLAPPGAGAGAEVGSKVLAL